MSVREELYHAKSTVKIVEIFPPPVQSELNKARTFGMPADEFAKQSYEKLIAGEDQVIIGSILGSDPKLFSTMMESRLAIFEALAKLMWSIRH
jgi:hypothetical protein